MKRIAFLAAPGGSSNDNRERLPAAFEAAGWRAALLLHESLGLTADGVAARDAVGRMVPLASFDLVWILGFGGRTSFLDRMQMLKTPDQARFVNTVDALVYLHGKFDLAEFGPKTHASADVDALMAIVAGGGRWVAKPTDRRLTATPMHNRCLSGRVACTGTTSTSGMNSRKPRVWRAISLASTARGQSSSRGAYQKAIQHLEYARGLVRITIG